MRVSSNRRLSCGVASIGWHRVDTLQRAIDRDKALPNDEGVASEIGAILNDDFLRADIRGKAEKYRMALAPEATIKIWGCNSGVGNWISQGRLGAFSKMRSEVNNWPSPSLVHRLRPNRGVYHTFHPGSVL